MQREPDGRHTCAEHGQCEGHADDVASHQTGHRADQLRAACRGLRAIRRGQAGSYAVGLSSDEQIIVLLGGYFISISTRQWSLGPHSLGSFIALTLTRSAMALDANTKSSWRVADVGL